MEQKLISYQLNIRLRWFNNGAKHSEHIKQEKKMMRKPATLNFLANENFLKHKELVTYLETEIGEKIEFKLNDEPFILADYELKNTLSIQNVKDILDITGLGIYKVFQLDEEFKGKYVLIISEDYGFESESNIFDDYIFSSQIETEIGVTKYLIHQISNYYANFVRIKEVESKTSQFKLFIAGLEYFEFYEGYSIIQPTKELMQKIDFMDDEDILKVKPEVDSIIKYTNSDVYSIEII